MSKMIIYFCLLIPLFLSIDSSSIRGRNLKNDLVPLENSRLDSAKKDSDSLRILSKEPFIVQLQIPKTEENETKETKTKDKRRKQSAKKRISKVKPVGKKHRNRRDLLVSRTKTRLEKPNQLENSHTVNATEHKFKNVTKNSISRAEILKALSLHSKNKDLKKNKADEIKNTRNESNEKNKHNTNKPNRNRHMSHLSYTDRTPLIKMAYPSTPKSDRTSHKYTYQDLIADRERLEQKIKYIKNMLNVNDSTADDAVRVRRRSESDRAANKIAKMFLTLSAVNGLHDKRKSKCNKDDEDDDDRVQDSWEKERKNTLNKKGSSFNEERYKVKKWIEFMKSKRSSGKTCPCMANINGEEVDTFPLEQKLTKDYYLMEKGKSSEESSESYRDPYYNPRDKLSIPKYKKQSHRTQEEQDKLKGLGKNGKKKLELPFDDLELYRSRAKQILRNAEEILDKIKEEEEKRLTAPNVLLSQLKELTSKIQGDPRNNENDLIRKLQKSLGWCPLAKSQENGEKNTFMDNVKSFILDPYEKAKALTDESTKKLSSYLLRNLGKLQESSEEQEEKNDEEETSTKNLHVYFGQVPQNEEQLLSANLAKENPESDLKIRDDTTMSVLSSGAEPESSGYQKERMEEIIKEQQKKINDYKVSEDSENSKELEGFDFKSLKDKIKGDKTKDEIVKEQKSDIVESENGNTERTQNRDSLSTEKPFLDIKEKFRSEKGDSEGTASRDMQEEEEFEKEVEEIIKTANEKDLLGNDQEVKIETENKENVDGNKKSKQELKPVATPSSIRANSGENDQKTNSTDSDVVASPHFLDEEDDSEAPPRLLINLNDYLSYDNEKDEETESFKEPVNLNGKTEKEDPAKANFEKNLYNSSRDPVNLGESFTEATLQRLAETPKEKESQEPLKDETSQMEVGGDEILEHPDLIQETNHNLRSDKKSSEQSEETEGHNDDEDNQTVGAGKENSETEDAVDDKYVTNSKEIVESSLKTSENDPKNMNEDPLKMNLENKKNSDENLSVENQRAFNEENEDEDLLEATKTENITEQGNNDETTADNRSREDAEGDEEKLGAEKPTEEVNSESFGKNTDDSQEEISEKVITDEENEKSNETLLKTALNEPRDENESDEDTTLDKTDEEVGEKTQRQNADYNDETPIDIILQDNDESPLKAANPKKGNVETKNSETDQKILSENNQEDEYADEKTLLKSEKSSDDDSLQKNLENIDESETLNDSLSKESLENTEEILSETGDPTETKTVNSDDFEPTVEAKPLNENVQIEKEASEETPLRSGWASKEQEELTTETSLKIEKPDEIQEENSNENIERLKMAQNDSEEESSEEGDEDKALLEKVKEDKTERVLDETSSSETLKAAMENQNGEKLEPTSRMEKSDEVQDENSKGESRDDTLTATQNDQDETIEKGDENEPFISMAKPVNVQEETLIDRSNDETLKSASDYQEEKLKDADENEYETSVRQKISDETELGNSDEKNNDETLKADLDDHIKENLEEDKITLTSNPDKVEHEFFEDKSNDDALKTALDNQEILRENKDEPSLKISKSYDTEEETLDEKDNDETVKMALDDQNNENSADVGEKETLVEKADNELNESNSNENGADDTLRTALDMDTQDNEEIDDEILKEAKSNEELEQRQEDENDDAEAVLKVASNNQRPEMTDQAKNNETPSQKVSSREEQDQTALQYPVDQKEQKPADDYERLLKAENLNNDFNSRENDFYNLDSREGGDDTLRATQENSKEVDEENLQLENQNKDLEDDETSLRNANLDQLDNAIDAKSSLKSKNNEKTEDIESGKAESKSAEAYREQDPDDLNNRIDQTNQNENIRSVHLDEMGNGSEESLYDTLKAANPLDENLYEENDNLEGTEANSQDAREEETSYNLLQEPGFTTKHLKTGNLKVPKSIGKIMEDLDGKEKGHVTSLQNLNPDMIDHIIDKIDEAEQQTLQSKEVDCRKECSCAEEIDTKSRTMGRYEIVKDFLHWMKDLQLNRVLSDD